MNDRKRVNRDVSKGIIARVIACVFLAVCALIYIFNGNPQRGWFYMFGSVCFAFFAYSAYKESQNQ